MKTILTILLSLLTIAGYGQRFRQGSQLYDFKLGMTIEEMKEDVDTFILEEDEKPNTLVASSSLGGRLRTFRLPEHRMGALHKLEDVRLYFFDNQLYIIEVHSFSSETETYLTKKHGKSKAAVEVEAEKSRLFKKQPYMSITQDWKIDKNKPLGCTSTTYLDRDLQIMAYLLLLVDTDVYQEVMDLGMKERLKK